MYTHCRILKQTLRSAGGALTAKHVEKVSMGVLFLLEAAKKTDRTFYASPQTTSHTVRSSCKDIGIMVEHLQEKKIGEKITGQNTAVCTTSWLKDRTSSMHHQDDEGESGEVELDYELFAEC